jgi:Tfp pilus assembly protein PilO
MFKFILPTILIGVAITGFFLLTNPLYKEITLKREQVASYNEALDNSKALEAERDKLTQKYNSFDPENLSKLQKLLPDNVDNIRLILEIEKIALPYGMTLKDVKYDATKKDTKDAALTQAVDMQEGENFSNRDYGILSLEFSTQGTYSNFINFIKDLENNLRIVDISSIQFTSSAELGLNPSLPEAYKYNFIIKTYWLKN